MRHLDEAEFVDLVDGTLHATRVAHAESCDACRAQANAVRATLSAVASTPAEEPSPLYWDGFAARVRERIDARASGRWFGLPRLAFVGLGALAAILLAVNLLAPRQVTGPGTPAAPLAATDVPFYDDLDADREWAVVRAAADGLDLEEAEAEGLTARPGAADRLAMELTAAERAELIRLLKEEVKTGA
jgi:hypothetical protein